MEKERDTKENDDSEVLSDKYKKKYEIGTLVVRNEIRI